MKLENKKEMINLKEMIMNNTSLMDKFKPYFKEFVKYVKDQDTNIMSSNQKADNSQSEKIETEIKSDGYLGLYNDAL